jgi:hypothetical protein
LPQGDTFDVKSFLPDRAWPRHSSQIAHQLNFDLFALSLILFTHPNRFIGHSGSSAGGERDALNQRKFFWRSTGRPNQIIIKNAKTCKFIQILI